MKKLLLFKGVMHSFILLCIIFFSSCSPCYYAPNAPNVPLFTEKNEATFSTSFHLGSISRGVDIQAAYAVSNHVGIMLNYNYYGGTQQSITFMGTSNQTKYRGNLFEIGGGYFRSVASKFIFETYAGVGYAGVKNNTSYSNSGTTADNSVNYYRFFLQPAMGWVPNEHIALAFSIRFGLLHYQSLNINIGEASDIYDLMNINNNPSFPIEPGFTFRVGGKVLKFQTQFFLTFLPGSDYANIDPLGFTFGMFFNIKGKDRNGSNGSQ